MAYARIVANRGRLEIKLGNPDGAKRQYDEALALTRDLLGPHDTEVAALLVEKAYALYWRDNDLSAAEQTAREAVEIHSAAVPKLHPDRVYAQAALGEILMSRNKLDEASLLLNEVLNATRKIHGENSRQTAAALDSLSKVARARQRFAEAERLAWQAVEAATRANGLNHSSVGFYRTALAAGQVERRNYLEAEVQARAALGVLAKTLPPDHPYVATAEYVLGEALLGMNQPKDAETFFSASMNRSTRAKQPAWRIARSASGLGESLYRQGRAAEAEVYLVDSYRILAAAQNADPTPLSAARERLVRFYTERAQHDRLREVLTTVDTTPASLERHRPARRSRSALAKELHPTSGGHP